MECRCKGHSPSANTYEEDYHSPSLSFSVIVKFQSLWRFVWSSRACTRYWPTLGWVGGWATGPAAVKWFLLDNGDIIDSDNTQHKLCSFLDWVDNSCLHVIAARVWLITVASAALSVVTPSSGSCQHQAAHITCSLSTDTDTTDFDTPILTQTSRVVPNIIG